MKLSFDTIINLTLNFLEDNVTFKHRFSKETIKKQYL